MASSSPKGERCGKPARLAPPHPSTDSGSSTGSRSHPTPWRLGRPRAAAWTMGSMRRRNRVGIGTPSRVIALSLLSLVILAFVLTNHQASAQSLPCGMSPNDWCPPQSGDPCGHHRTAAACRADAACYAMPYRGESVVRCIFDERGFASNCPTVGCTSTPPSTRGN